jgi:hypothetical protein
VQVRTAQADSPQRFSRSHPGSLTRGNGMKQRLRVRGQDHDDDEPT